MSLKIVTYSEFDRLKEEEGSYLIDVRENYEFEDGNIGGVNIPMKEVSSKMEELSAHKSLLLCCKSGKRSYALGYALNQKNPHLNIFSLEGGLEAIQNKA